MLLILDLGDAIVSGMPSRSASRTSSSTPGSGWSRGVVRAFEALQRALPLLEPDRAPERREIVGPYRLRRARVTPSSASSAPSRKIATPSTPHWKAPISRKARFTSRLATATRRRTLNLRDGFATAEFFLDSVEYDGGPVEVEQESLLAPVAHSDG
jgi:hypothetical protein